MEFIGNNHPIPVIHPADITTNATNTDIVGLKEYNHATFLVQTGTNSVGCTLTVQECDDVTPSNSTAIAFNYREMATVDTWGSLTASASTGVTIAAADDNHMFAIEVDADELTDGYPYVRVCLSAPASGNNYYSAVAIMSEPRHGLEIPVSAVD